MDKSSKAIASVFTAISMGNLYYKIKTDQRQYFLRHVQDTVAHAERTFVRPHKIAGTFDSDAQEKICDQVISTIKDDLWFEPDHEHVRTMVEEAVDHSKIQRARVLRAKFRILGCIDKRSSHSSKLKTNRQK
jgi:hypothetical protein